MGWFLMGIAIGWSVSGIYWYNQTEDNKVGGGAAIIAIALFLIALVVGINLGIASGSIPIEGIATPTPQLVGVILTALVVYFW